MKELIEAAEAMLAAFEQPVAVCVDERLVARADALEDALLKAREQAEALDRFAFKAATAERKIIAASKLLAEAFDLAGEAGL